jgi:hypothetical protein
MLLSPEEFLKQSSTVGMGSAQFKQVMCTITADEEHLQHAFNLGMKIYFSFNSRKGLLNYFAEHEEKLFERLDEDDDYIEAFKLLKIIAD